MSDLQHLRRDIARLTAALDAAVTKLGGAETHVLCRQLGLAAQELRAGTLAGGRAGFGVAISRLDHDGLEDVARAHAAQCHLMNIAEERERLRVLRVRGEHPADGLAAAVDLLIDRGATTSDMRQLFSRALVMPVLTAHPTEARRRSTLDHLGRIEQLLGELEATGRSRVAA